MGRGGRLYSAEARGYQEHFEGSSVGFIVADSIRLAHCLFRFSGALPSLRR